MPRSIERTIAGVTTILAITAMAIAGLLAQSTVTVNPLTSGTTVGGQTYRGCGTLTTSVTATSTTAVTTEENLWTSILPANALDADGRGVRITVHIQTAPNANTKTLRVYFGATQVAIMSGTYNNLAGRIVIEVLRTGAATQTATFAGNVSSIGLAAGNTAPTETLSGAVQLRMTGQNNVASAGDITLRGVVVECL